MYERWKDLKIISNLDSKRKKKFCLNVIVTLQQGAQMKKRT